MGAGKPSIGAVVRLAKDKQAALEKRHQGESCQAPEPERSGSA